MPAVGQEAPEHEAWWPYPEESLKAVEPVGSSKCNSKIAPEGYGAGVNVTVGVADGMVVGVGVGAKVAVLVGVAVAGRVAVIVADAVGVRVRVGVPVGEAVA
jgi:hypothetical protein